MNELKRRNFLKLSGLAMVPAFLPSLSKAEALKIEERKDAPAPQLISFTDDGILIRRMNTLPSCRR